MFEDWRNGALGLEQPKIRSTPILQHSITPIFPSTVASPGTYRTPTRG